MILFLLRRLGWGALVICFLVSCTFAITVLLPADPVHAILGPHGDAATIMNIRHQLCLDRSRLAQYGCFVGRVAHGDLGQSFRTQRPVADILLEHLWPTLQLTLGALFLQLLIGVPIGILSALKRNRAPDLIGQALTLIGQSIPIFTLGPLLLYFVAYRFDWLPVSGYGASGWDRIRHLILPALTLAMAGAAYYARLLRTELIEVLDEDYVRTARAKGLSQARVVIVHGLRNALMPLLTLVGLDLGVLLGGAVVTEYIFAWPGIGREAVTSILNVDLPVIVGIVLISGVMIVVASLLVDIGYALLDPRVRLD